MMEREVPAEESLFASGWEYSFKLMKDNLKEFDINFKPMSELFRNEYKTSKQAKQLLNLIQIKNSLIELVLSQREKDLLKQEV